MSDSFQNSSARAIRKIAFHALRHFVTFFAHILALFSGTYPFTKSCKHDFCSRVCSWLNCFGIFYNLGGYTCNKVIQKRNKDARKCAQEWRRSMKVLFRQNIEHDYPPEEDYTPVSLKDCIEKTRQALDAAYAGFDNATDFSMIDSYIYEINSLQMRYKHLTALAAAEPKIETDSLNVHSPIRALVSHVFG